MSRATSHVETVPKGPRGIDARVITTRSGPITFNASDQV